MQSSLTFALQALLARHEAYMADAERDRLDLTGRIERLEMDKQQLQAENASTLEENRSLLDQLELLNNTVSESDVRIKTLEASLLSSRQSVRQLENATARAADAERHLAWMEEEQERLHLELHSSREDALSHAQRCKEAQRGILDMQDQLERIEKEAREERQRHVETVGRMERQREVEKQLDTAAGRLKAAAASKSLQSRNGGGGAVGQFVRDLLQDNASLQLGIAELREMLTNSNEEIHTLREQLLYHQPAYQDGALMPSALKAELEAHDSTPTKLSQELHIHHHYHVSPKQDARKFKRRRSGLVPAVVSPSNLSSSPIASDRSRIEGSPTSPILPSCSNQNPALVPSWSMAPSSAGRWTALSNPPSEFASSVPTSPVSNQRHFIFDHVPADSDLPTSPSSYDPASPAWYPSHSKRPSEVSSRSVAFASLDSLASSPPTPHLNRLRHRSDTIEEEREVMTVVEHVPVLTEQTTATEDSVTEESDISPDDFMSRPKLRRASSHESIMSLTGGLDIHTLKVRPIQMSFRPLGTAGAIVTGVNAQPTLSRVSSKRSDAALRDTFAGLQCLRSDSGVRAGSMASRQSSSPSPTREFSMSPSNLGKWIGWRPWGSSDMPTGRYVSCGTGKPRETSRPPGINQAGAIPGFQHYWASQKRKGAPAQVNAESIDREALEDCIQE